MKAADTAMDLPKPQSLFYRLNFLEMDQKRLEAQQEQGRDVTIEMIELAGRMKECMDWIRIYEGADDWGELVIEKDGSRHPKMPTFGTRARVREGVENRHLGRQRETPEEIAEGREKLHQQEARGVLRGIQVARANNGTEETD